MNWLQWTLAVGLLLLAAHSYTVIGDLSSVEETMQREIDAWK